MRVAILIDGHDGVEWESWLSIARECEAEGIETLFSSDHYMSSSGGGGLPALDSWTVLSALAASTSRLRLGTMVSPVSFRHPSVLAKVVTTVDRISAGRAELGLGLGWFEREHLAYGFVVSEPKQRREILAEQLRVIRLHWGEGPASLHTARYRLDDLDAQPKPVQSPGPPVLIGGRGGPRSLELAAAHADEYNLVFGTPEDCRVIREALDVAARVGGAPLRLSASIGAVIADTSVAAAREAASLGAAAAFPRDVCDSSGLPRSWVVGSAEVLRERFRELEDAGVDRVVVQLPDHERLDLIALVAESGRLVSR